MITECWATFSTSLGVTGLRAWLRTSIPPPLRHVGHCRREGRGTFEPEDRETTTNTRSLLSLALPWFSHIYMTFIQWLQLIQTKLNFRFLLDLLPIVRRLRKGKNHKHRHHKSATCWEVTTEGSLQPDSALDSHCLERTTKAALWSAPFMSTQAFRRHTGWKQGFQAGTFSPSGLKPSGKLQSRWF